MEQKQIEHALSKIGSKVADATALSRKAKELVAASELLMMAAQREIENLYVTLDEREE